MTRVAVRIDSYFSLPTDLASEMRAWPEFISGEGYRVELGHEQERVSVALIPAREDDSQHIVLQGESTGRLFFTVLGRVSYSLAAHSDDISLCHWYS